jgi:hypothetical protein
VPVPQRLLRCYGLSDLIQQKENSNGISADTLGLEGPRHLQRPSLRDMTGIPIGTSSLVPAGLFEATWRRPTL